MTVITSGAVVVVDTFYAIRDSLGFWKEIERDDVTESMIRVGDPYKAMRFETVDDVCNYLDKFSSFAEGKADAVQIKATTKIEKIK